MLTTERQLCNDLVQILLDERTLARERNDYELADRIRDKLLALEVYIEDRPAFAQYSSYTYFQLPSFLTYAKCVSVNRGYIIAYCGYGNLELELVKT